MNPINVALLQALVGILFLRISKYNGVKWDKLLGFLFFVLAGFNLWVGIFK